MHCTQWRHQRAVHKHIGTIATGHSSWQCSATCCAWSGANHEGTNSCYHCSSACLPGDSEYSSFCCACSGLDRSARLAASPPSSSPCKSKCCANSRSIIVNCRATCCANSRSIIVNCRATCSSNFSAYCAASTVTDSCANTGGASCCCCCCCRSCRSCWGSSHSERERESCVDLQQANCECTASGCSRRRWQRSQCVNIDDNANGDDNHNHNQ
mmetsp:Transcript_41528/g.97454  ORF Transcript_41528/g.97454 Transcript_41528/m.97454 type:complete len:213 (+) Transcript_41528:813-1451(+)